MIAELRASPFKQFVYMFVATVVIQTLHMVEHVAQVFQKFVLDYSYAHGLIGSFDLEQCTSLSTCCLGRADIYGTAGWLNFGKREVQQGRCWVPC